MASIKVPRQLTKQIEYLESVVATLNGLIDGKKVNVENYDKDFLKKLSAIRKDGLDLRDKIQIFKGELEEAINEEYSVIDKNPRFASEDYARVDKEAAKKVVDSFITNIPKY